MMAPHFNYAAESQTTGLAGVRRSTRVFCDPPFALSRYRSEDRKDGGNTFGLTGMWPRSLWATNHIPRRGLERSRPAADAGLWELNRLSPVIDTIHGSSKYRAKVKKVNQNAKLRHDSGSVAREASAAPAASLYAQRFRKAPSAHRVRR